MNVSLRTSTSACYTTTANKNIFAQAAIPSLLRWFFVLVMFVVSVTSVNAQTTLISPTGDGGFENGATFLANGWTESSGANNPWVVGTAVTAAPITGNSAYISTDGGVTNSYVPTNNATNYFYRDVTVPSGESVITLTFNWQQQGENTWDIWQVYTAPTTVVPVGVATHPGSGQLTVPAGITGATALGGGSVLTGVQTATFTLNPALAGTTFRLIFSWKNETGGVQPPASIDNISLISRVPIAADAAPTTFNATLVTGTSMTIDWVDASTNETGFNVYRSTDNVTFTKIGATIASTTTATTGTVYSQAQPGLLPGITYYFRIAANFEMESPYLTGNQATIAAGNIVSEVAGGLWSQTTTWVGGVVPLATDNVTIADGATVTIDVTTAVCNNLTVGQGTSGVLTHIVGATASTLTVSGDVTITTGGSFVSGAGTAAKNLNIGGSATTNSSGNLTVNGSFQANSGATAVTTVNFLGSLNGTISGTGTINFAGISVNKGTTQTGSTMELLVAATMTAPPTAGNRLVITAGTFKMSAASAWSPYFGAATICAINGRLWLNHAGASVQCVGTGVSATGAGNATVTGELRIDNGTFGYGQGNNTMTFSTTTGVLRMAGGTLNMYGAITFSSSAGTQFIMSGGNINVDPQNVTNMTSTTLFSIGFSTTVNWSGGIITIVDPHATAGNTAFSSSNSTSKTVTGGTLRIGDGISTISGGTLSATSGFGITSSMPIWNLEINNRADLSQSRMARLTGSTTISNLLDIKTGGYLFVGSSTTTATIFMNGNIINEGTLSGTHPTGTATLGTIQFGTANALSISGGGLFTNLATLSMANTGAGLTMNQTNQFNVNRINMFFVGGITNAGKITWGNGAATTGVVQYGQAGGTVVAGSLDAAPTFNLGTGGMVLIYSQESAARSTGVEVPPTRIVTSTTISNTNGVNLTGGSLATGTLALTAGLFNTSAANMPTITGTTAASITGGSATSYVNGPMARTLPASLATAATYNFPVGKSSYNNFELVNPTTNAGGTVIVQAEVFDGNAGGTPGNLMESISTTRYWAASLDGSTSANFINSNIRLNDVTGTQNAIANSATLTGAYDLTGGVTSTVLTNSILTGSPVTSIGNFYLMGNKAAATLTNLAITPTGNQCINVARTVTVTATPGGAAITGVEISYQVNGGTAVLVSMTNVGGDNWSGVIPTVTPSNGSVTWSVIATDANALTKTETGTPYQDEPLTGLTVNVTPVPSSVCLGSSTTITASLAGGPAPSYTLPPAVSFPTSDEDFGNITITDATTSAVVLNNTTAGGSLTGTIGVATGTAGSYSNFTAFGPYILSSGTLYNISLTSITQGGNFSNVLAAWIDYNRDGDFGDAGENVFNQGASISGPHTSTGSFTVPGNVSPGLARMRVLCSETSSITSPTQSVSWGEYEEYMVNLVPVITAYSWSDGTNTVGTANPLIISPSVTTTYTATLTAANCPISSAPLTVTVNPLPNQPLGNNSSQCGLQIPTAFVVTGFSSGSTNDFRWYDAASGGNLLQTGGTTYGTAISTNTSFWVSEFDGTCESPRTQVDVVVVAPDPISVAVSNNNPCTNSPITLTATNIAGTPVNTYTYVWTATPAAGSGIPTSVAGNPVNVTPDIHGSYVYTATATDGSCVTSANSVTVNTIAPPVIESATANPMVICEGASTVLTANTPNGATGAGTRQFGTGTGSNGASTTIGAFYATWYGNGHGQILITAAELTAAGFLPGAPLTALSIDVSALAGDVADQTLNNFTISLGSVPGTTTGITTFQTPTLSTVWGPANYTPVVGNNTHTFSSGFVWDGTSAIIVDYCFANGIVGNGSAVNTVSTISPAAYVNYQVDNSAPTVCTITTVSNASSTRPNIKFTGTVTIPGPGTLTWVWNPGAMAGNSVTVTPSVTTVYTVTATDPGTTCTQSQNVTVTVNANPNAPSAVGSEHCGSLVPTATVSSNSGAPTPVFNWYDAASGGTLLQTGTSNTYLSPIAVTTTLYVSELSGDGCESTRTPVTITVIESDPISANATGTPFCIGSAVTLNANHTPNNNTYVFTWTASPEAGSGITGSVLGQNVSVTPTATGTYVYTVTAFDVDKGCTNTATVTVTVSEYPTITAVSGVPPSVCAGAPVTLSGSYVPISTGIATVGTGTLQNSTSSYPTPFGNYYGGAQGQYMITAAELTASGLQAGNVTSIAWDIASAYSGDPMASFQVMIAPTTQTDMSAPVTTGYTTVIPAFTYTPPAATGWATLPFSTPFVWDGTSNIVVNVSFLNCIVCNGTPTCTTSYFDNGVVRLTTTSYLSAFNYYADDNCTINTLSPSGSGNATVAGARPNMQLGGTVATNLTNTLTWVWNPGAVAGASVTVNPTTTTAYTVTATNAGGCSTTSAPVTITVYPTPATPTATNSTQCGPGVPTASVSGSTGTFLWYDAATGGTLLQTGGSTYASSISVTTTFYVAESDGTCESARVAVVATVTNGDPIVASVDDNEICPGTPIQLSSTQGTTNIYAFTWTASPEAGSGITGSTSGQSVSVTPTAGGTYVYTVTGFDGTCTTISTVSVLVNPNPAVDSIKAAPSTICVGGASILSVYSSIEIAGPATLPTGYCTDATALGGSAITGVTFNTLSNTGVTQVAPFFDTYPATGTNTTTIKGGLSYNLNVTTNGSAIVSVWIDYDRSGTYEDSEWQQVFTTGSTGSITVNVPLSAAAGWTAMRVRSRIAGNPNGPTNDCFSFGSGSTQDYTVNILGTIPQNPDLVYTWTPGGVGGPNLTVTPTTTTSYSVSLYNTVTGCTSAPANVTVTVLPVGATAAAAPTSSCAGGSVLLTSSPTGGGPFTFSWSDGTNVIGTSETMTVSPTTTTTYTVTVTDACGNFTSSAVVVTVNPLPTASIAETGPITLCEPATQTLTAVTNASAPAYQWSINGEDILGANASTYVATQTGNYTVAVTETGTGCISLESAAVSVTINGQPTALTIEPTSATVCAGSPVTLNASGGLVSTAVTFGTAGIQNAVTSTTNLPPYGNYYTANRHQMLVLASELTAQGLVAGSSISSVSFDVVSNASTIGYKDFTVKAGLTTASALTTTYLTDPTTLVYTSAMFTPVPGWNAHNFSSNIVWDGTSNLIVETHFTNCEIGAATCATTTCSGVASGTNWQQNAITNQTATSFVSHAFFYSDGTNACGTGPATVVTAFSAVSVRPDMRFNATIPSVVTWTPATGLNVATGYTVIASPTTTTTYTANAVSQNGCPGVSPATVTVTVNPTPVVSFSGLAATYCDTDVAVTLTGSPSGGTFSGTGISGNSFDPAVAGLGTHIITYSYTDGNGCTGTTTQSVTVQTCANTITVNLKLFLQGYYVGGSQMQPVLANQGVGVSSTDCDNIFIELHDATTFALIGAPVTAVLQTDGTVSATFAQAPGSYYIAIRHRNTVQTWSANPVACTASTPLYDFSSAATQAMGDNQVLVSPGVYAFYTGDLNQDDFVDSNDYPAFDLDNFNGVSFSYVATDMNGDGFVDSNDYPVFDANSFAGVTSIHP